MYFYLQSLSLLSLTGTTSYCFFYFPCLLLESALSFVPEPFKSRDQKNVLSIVKFDCLKLFIHFSLHFVNIQTIIVYKIIYELVLSPYPNLLYVTLYVNIPISHIRLPLNSIFPQVSAIAILSSWHALLYSSISI